MNATHEAMIGVREAARILGCSETGIRRLVNNSRRKAAGSDVRQPTIRFFQASKNGDIKFLPRWIGDFIAGNTIDPDDYVTPAPAARHMKSRRSSAHVLEAKHGLDPALLA
jgi:hypothetical protein